MTIERGQAWGELAGPLPAVAPICSSDAEIRHVLTDSADAGRPPPVVGLTGGDLCRTVGGTGSISRLRSSAAVHLPIDVAVVEFDGARHLFVAHLVARRRLWSGPFAVVMNAQFHGAWNLAPRGHPNDGRLEVTEGSLTWADREKARRRARFGTHIPHPRLRTRQTSEVQLCFTRAVTVRLDGEPVGRTRELSVRVRPDALTVVV